MGRKGGRGGKDGIEWEEEERRIKEKRRVRDENIGRKRRGREEEGWNRGLGREDEGMIDLKRRRKGRRKEDERRRMRKDIGREKDRRIGDRSEE